MRHIAEPMLRRGRNAFGAGAIAFVMSVAGPAVAADETIAVTMNGADYHLPVADYLVLDIDMGNYSVPVQFTASAEDSERREGLFASVRSKHAGTLPVLQISYMFYLADADCAGDGYLRIACDSKQALSDVLYTQLVLWPSSIAGAGTQMLRPAALEPASVAGEVKTFSQEGWTYVETLSDGARLAASCAPAIIEPWVLVCRHGATLAEGIFYQLDFSVRDTDPAGIIETVLATRAAAASLLAPAN